MLLPKTLLILSTLNPSWNETVVATPLEGYHMNLKSPQSCGGSERVVMEERRVECRMTKAGEQKLELFVCDDANSFCRREEIVVSVKYPTSISGWWDMIFH